MWTIFKVFIEFVTISLLFYVLGFWPWGMWDLSSLARDWTCIPCIGRWSLNHWTARKVPGASWINIQFTLFSLLIWWLISKNWVRMSWHRLFSLDTHVSLLSLGSSVGQMWVLFFTWIVELGFPFSPSCPVFTLMPSPLLLVRSHMC